MQKALKDLGISGDLVDEFKNLYIVRGRDAMHSLGHEQKLTFEEAGKCKILCDLMLFKFCESKFKTYVSNNNEDEKSSNR